ncbi:methionine synthase [Methanothermococcus okinawensis]|uniref:Methionine synthase vitamin-B12 independent n=1 Tax=Methanothermococcus okinawensis (strain DSM 14208 / JCM 11175 / IH1) TaxID=647113 RepID=F8AKD6_METOI|nr:methionine synthase [Methanothermococcus okinawensis]AEH06336.1 Methionine synthase vitamin-B12 independent [Methanothermococcus okinawensis IH1]
MIKTVVGSYPVVIKEPESFLEKIKDKLGLFDKYKYAIEKAVMDQLNAGIDILSDGQVRGDMVEIFVSNLYGFEGKKVVNKIEYTQPITLKDIKFANAILNRNMGKNKNTKNNYKNNKHKRKSIKGILTGPCTIASSIRVENYYSDNKDESLIYDLANALKKEAEAIQNHVSMIQIDEPILSTGMYELDTAKRAIKRITENLKVPVAMHVCGNVSNIFEELNTFNIDILDHEFASNRKNLDILEFIDRKVGFGCINTKLKSVESVDEVKDLLNEGLEILNNNKSFIGLKGTTLDKLNNYVIIDPDCGMRLLPLDVAYNKLKNMVIASEEFENEVEMKK